MKNKNGKLWGKILNGEIEIRSLTKADIEESLDILDKSFFLNEVVCNGCEINLPQNSQARQELRELCRITAEDGVSLIAKDAITGKVAAVSFNKIQFIPPNNDDPFFVKFRKEQTHSPQAQCLMDFMITVDGQCDVFEKFKLDCVCELMFLATLPEYERRGIGRALARYTIELSAQLSQGKGGDDIGLHPSLRQMRPQAVTALFTSQFSQKVGRAENFQVINSVPYTGFSYNGKTFDKRINPMHSKCEHVIYLL